MKEKLQKFCEHEIMGVERWGYNAHDAVTRCYGAVMFLLYNDLADEEIGKWWDDEMLPKFRELEMR